MQLQDDDYAFLDAMMMLITKESAEHQARANFRRGCLSGILITASLASLLMTPKPFVKSIIKKIPNPLSIEQRVKAAKSYGDKLQVISSHKQPKPKEKEDRQHQ